MPGSMEYVDNQFIAIDFVSVPRTRSARWGLEAVTVQLGRNAKAQRHKDAKETVLNGPWQPNRAARTKRCPASSTLNLDNLASFLLCVPALNPSWTEASGEESLLDNPGAGERFMCYL